MAELFIVLAILLALALAAWLLRRPDRAKLDAIAEGRCMTCGAPTDGEAECDECAADRMAW